jgi:ceramide glucosyltransferase
MPPRKFFPWLLTWIGREVLAMPIWTTAVLLGRSVNWRGNEFLVRSDMTVEEIQGRKPASKPKANGSKKMS